MDESFQLESADHQSSHHRTQTGDAHLTNKNHLHLQCHFISHIHNKTKCGVWITIVGIDRTHKHGCSSNAVVDCHSFPGPVRTWTIWSRCFYRSAISNTTDQPLVPTLPTYYNTSKSTVTNHTDPIVPATRSASKPTTTSSVARLVLVGK